MKAEPNKKRIQEIKDALKEIETRKQSLLSELKSLELSFQGKPQHFLGNLAFPKVPETPDEKVELFLYLFRCRCDVFPRFWENPRNGKKGYSPVCANEWRENICFKPKVKCMDCVNQAFVSFEKDAARDHLTGKTAMGSYAIDMQDRCVFLAADFDKSTWKDDVLAYQSAAEVMDIQVSIEISKSGNGAHAWIFFDHAVPARKARKLGDVILSKALGNSDTFNLGSYDRFFPNQDYLPSGGFGNLIALPLQKNYRDGNRSIFVDTNLEIFPDQWDYLSNVYCLTEHDLDYILEENISSFEYRNSEDTIDNDLHIAETILRKKIEPEDQFSEVIEIGLASQISIPLKSLPGIVLGNLKKIATIANPKYFENQRMRFSTWNIPKYIFCGENDNENIYLPRGLLPEIRQALIDNGFEVIIRDQRANNEQLEVSFSGELFDHQLEAVKAIKNHEYSVLVAPTGTGKTVMAINLITLRKTPTLILVHRSTLIDQWIDSVCKFVPELEKKDIGVLGSGRRKLKGSVDIAMLQSLANIDALEEITKGYDFLIIDECHRIPTVTFEPVMKAINVKYVLGLTATPQRKDHFQSIIFMQCGPVRHVVKDVNRETQVRNVHFRSTDVPELGRDASIQDLWEALIGSDSRNALIIGDILDLLKNNKSPLVLSDRIDHIEILVSAMENKTEIPAYVLKGGVGKKERQEIIHTSKQMFQEQKPFCLFATGSLIGEGFDLPEFDTMVLTLPISFKGRLTQYVGRLHRQSTLKQKTITVYDYVDTCSGMTISMFRKRIPAYKKLGYNFIYDFTDKIDLRRLSSAFALV